MTAPAELPKIVFAVGVPDGMDGRGATELFEAGRLRGISAISLALLPWLRARGHPFTVTMFGSWGTLSHEAAHGVRDETAGRVLVNLICDPDTHPVALDQVARLELATQLPQVNPAWVVRTTTRQLVARRLAHQSGVRVAHCTSFRAGALTLVEHIERRGHRYPVLLRPPGGHGSVGLVRVDAPGEIRRHPEMLKTCTVTDFVDFRSTDGLWRKYRMVVAGDHLFRRHVLMDRDWNLTGAARRFMDDRPQLAAEEQAWLSRPVTLQDGSVEARVMHQFRALQLDFGCIDFALTPDGDVVVFEINACVQLTNPDSVTTGERYFEANNEEILDALQQAICARAAAGGAAG